MVNMVYLDVLEFIVAIICAGCIGSFITLKKTLDDCKDNLLNQSSKVEDLNKAIAKEHNAMADKVISLEERLTHVQNYINSTTFSKK